MLYKILSLSSLQRRRENKMSKYCFNYESGEYEWIEKDGYSIDRGEYVYNWDNSEYRREEEEEQQNLWEDDEEHW